jgi:redox-sensitive bicupin YhaK (pirin superfamily)
MLDLVLDAQRRALGSFDVGRVLPSVKRRMVGPFIFLDHIGPLDLPRGIPRSYDVRPHPHIGLSTVTYLFEGEIMHRDSVGSEQPVRPGEVNWMVAGRGISHSERFERARSEGGAIHAVQSWVALPDEHEETEPGFANHPQADLPVVETPGVFARVVAGEVFGARSPVRTHSPLFYAHCVLAAGAALEVPPAYTERAAYLVSGTALHEGQRFGAGQLLIFAHGAPAALSAAEPTTLMLLGGEPVGERFIEWNFVASSRERIEQAKADWRARRMKLPDLDDAEFIPLPGEK